MDVVCDIIFNDEYVGRRSGLIRALTVDLQRLLAECDRGKEALCLYGYPDGTWELKKPPDELPTNEPEPHVGINRNRKRLRLKPKQWVKNTAMYCDAWLLRMAFVYAGRYRISARQRAILHEKISSLETVLEATRIYFVLNKWPQGFEKNSYQLRDR